MRRLWMVALLFNLGACSNRNAEVKTGPAPEATRIPGTSTAGSEPEEKNQNAAANASTASRFGIPPGHLPPPGACRVWMPGEPPGQQKKSASGDCALVSRQVPAGGWLVYRPSGDKKEVVVREYGPDHDVVSIKVFDIVTGAFLREVDPNLNE